MSVNLVDLKNQIEKAANAGEFILYPCDDLSERSDSLEILGKDVSYFFSIAKKMGAKIVYMAEILVERGEPNPTWQLGSLQLGVLHGGVFHYIEKQTDWYEELATEEEEDEYEEDDEESEEEHRSPPPQGSYGSQ